MRSSLCQKSALPKPQSYLSFYYLHPVTSKHTVRLHINEAFKNFPYRFLMQNSYISRTLQRNQINEHIETFSSQQLSTWKQMWCGSVRANQTKGKAETRQNRNPAFTGRKRKPAVKNVNNWQSVLLQSMWLIQEHCYLIVMISPGFARMYQLQLIRAGYSDGHPGLVIVPLGDRICSGISPQAKKNIYIESNPINVIF